MSDIPLSPVGLNIVGLNVNERTAAQAAAFLNENSTASSSDGVPSMDATYNSHDSGTANATMPYPPTPQVPIKLPTISSSSSESEEEGDAATDSAGNAAANGAAVATSNLASGRSSPPPNCAICLGRCKNKCYTESCMHTFCFKCLCEWSKVKPECPLCKQTFSSIIHNVKSDNQFEEYHVQPQTVTLQQRPPPYMEMFNSNFVRNDNEWETYRITGAQMIETYRRMYTTRMAVGEGRPANAGTGSPGSIATQDDFIRMFPDGMPLGNHTQMWRRYIYERQLYAQPVCDITGRFRESSARFYRENPAQVYRLMPWINREIVCLLRNTAHDVSSVMTIINDSITVMNILSPSFRRRLQPFLGTKTAHFIHELNNFARAPYDIIGYDRNVQYARQDSEEIVIDFSSSGSSDDSERERNQSDVSSSFTVNVTVELNEGGGMIATMDSGEAQPTAMNLTTHNRSSTEVINLDDVMEVVNEEMGGDSASAGTSGASATGGASSTSGAGAQSAVAASAAASASTAAASALSTAPPAVPVENIELNSSSSDECEFVLERKPPHLRTPEMVSLNSDSDSDVVFVEETKAPASATAAAKGKSLLKPQPPLSQTGFSTTDEDEADPCYKPSGSASGSARRSKSVKYELEQMFTGASTSRGLRASGRRRSDQAAATAAHPEAADAKLAKLLNGVSSRHRSLRSSSGSGKSKRACVDSLDIFSGLGTDSSSSDSDDYARRPARKRKAAAESKETGAAGRSSKRRRRKSKKARKSKRAAATATTASSASASDHVYHASDSESDLEENLVLKALRTQLTGHQYTSDSCPAAREGTADSSSSPHPAEDQPPADRLQAEASDAPTTAGAAATTTRRNESLNLTNAIRKIQTTWRNNAKLEHSEAAPSTAPAGPALTSSSDMQFLSYNTATPILSSSPALPGVGDSIYTADGNRLSDYERFLDEQSQNRDYDIDAHGKAAAAAAAPAVSAAGDSSTPHPGPSLDEFAASQPSTSRMAAGHVASSLDDSLPAESKEALLKHKLKLGRWSPYMLASEVDQLDKDLDSIMGHAGKGGGQDVAAMKEEPKRDGDEDDRVDSDENSDSEQASNDSDDEDDARGGASDSKSDLSDDDDADVDVDSNSNKYSSSSSSSSSDMGSIRATPPPSQTDSDS